jgi:uncharacterized protein with HEPN domain
MSKQTARDPKLYVKEIIEHIGYIEEYTRGCTYEAFLNDRKTIDAVDKNLEVVGEALNRLSKRKDIRDKLYYYRINWRMLKDFRNSLSHEYFSRDITDIWKTATAVLPSLKPQFEKLLKELQQPQSA